MSAIIEAHYFHRRVTEQMRLFIAINFTENVRLALHDTMITMKRQNILGRFTPPENLHLTLAFIGETTRTDEIINIIDSLDATAFNITLGGYGNFAALYWVGIRPNNTLERLTLELKNTLRIGGFPIEERPFKPHITLVRNAFSDKPISISFPDTKMRVHRISLMKSEQINDRTVYTEIYGRDI